MECESVTENTMDSIDETIFEDFYSLDITMPFSCEFPKITKTQQPDSTEIVSVPASPPEITRSPQITSPTPLNGPSPIPLELSQTSPQSPPASQKLLSKESNEPTLELSPNSPSEYSSLSPMKSLQLSPKSEYKSVYDIPSQAASNLSVLSSPESPTLSMEFFANTLTMSPKISREAIPIASPKKSPASFRSSSKLEMSSKSIGLQFNNKISPGMLPKSTSVSSLKSSNKMASGFKSTSKQTSLPKLLSNSPLVPHSGPGSIFSPHFSVDRNRSRNVSCRKRIIVDEPLIVFSPDVNPQTLKSSTLKHKHSSPSLSVTMKENKVPTKLPNRFESPTEIHKSLLLHQVSGRTNHSPIYTPFTSMVTRFKNLAIESPFVPAGKANVSNESSAKADQPKTRVEKIKLISPLLRSPKLKVISAKHPLRSNLKVTNSVEKKSPTSAQYKAKTPIIQGSRIPVLKLN